MQGEEIQVLDRWHDDGIAFAKQQIRLCGLHLAAMKDCPEVAWAFWLGYKAEKYRDGGAVPEIPVQIAASA